MPQFGTCIMQQCFLAAQTTICQETSTQRAYGRQALVIFGTLHIGLLYENSLQVHPQSSASCHKILVCYTETR